MMTEKNRERGTITKIFSGIIIQFDKLVKGSNKRRSFSKISGYLWRIKIKRVLLPIFIMRLENFFMFLAINSAMMTLSIMPEKAEIRKYPKLPKRFSAMRT